MGVYSVGLFATGVLKQLVHRMAYCLNQLPLRANYYYFCSWEGGKQPVQLFRRLVFPFADQNPLCWIRIDGDFQYYDCPYQSSDIIHRTL